MNVKVVLLRYTLCLFNGINSTIYEVRGQQAQEKDNIEQLLQDLNDAGMLVCFSILSTKIR